MQSHQDEIRFDADELVAEAIEQTGFSDFGSLPYREGLEALLATYDRHVRDPKGRKRCRRRVLGLLATRLRCENALRTIPEIAEQEIVAPIFVTGLPRSGTSALLNLLATAPDNSGIPLWECTYPDPWPGSGPGDEDPRYQPMVDAMGKAADSSFNKIHHNTPDTPEECVMLHSFALHGVQHGWEIMLEPYRSWLLGQDHTPLYAYQKKLMQMLNWRHPRRQWLLKAPAHMHAVDAIMAVFPDARFVWCHRDPQAVVPSINSMNKAVMSMDAGDCSHIDAGEMGRSVMDWYAMSLEKGLASREALPAELFVDCSQREFVEQPMQLVERIYRSHGLPFTEAARAAMQAHTDANPKGKFGKHEYNLAEYGLTRELIDSRFAFYTGDARWPISD